MNLTFRDLVRAAVATLRDPRAAARRVMQVQMERTDRWMVLALIADISAIAAFLSFALNAQVAGIELSAGVMMPPLAMAFSQFVVMVTMVFAIDIVGRAMGGEGRIDDAILLVSWVQTILILLQLAQILLTLVFPLLGVLIGVFGVFLLFWLLTIFITEMHGFRSPWSVFLVMLVVSVVIATVLRSLFAMVGIDLIGVV